MELWQVCSAAVGKKIYFKGTNGDEYDEVNHRMSMEGFGLCKDWHNSHGLCVIVDINGKIFCIDPTDIKILEEVPSCTQAKAETPSTPPQSNSSE